MKKFLIGVNYWPRRSAMYMWKRFDLTEIREDLARIAEWGLRFVRFFLIWEDFAPDADRLDGAMRDRLVAFVDAAGAAGLACMPTLFTGHMSGVNWLPEWTLDPAFPSQRFRTINERGVRPYGVGDFYSGALLGAQVRFARAMATALRGHPSMLAWDLGNEFSNLRAPARSADAAEWSKRLTHVLESGSGIGVTAGLHGEDLSEDRNIRLSSIASPWRYATMHGYAAYSSFAASPADANVVPFLHDLTRTFSHRAVLFSEAGTPGPNAGGSIRGLDENEAAKYSEAVLNGLWRHGALGAGWWCFADYQPALAVLPPFDLAPHELSFGMIRADGSEKPVASVLSRFAKLELDVVESPAPLALDEEAYYAGLPETLNRAYASFVSSPPAGGSAR
jgi:endo-1,4-beta-mannosidase